METIELLEMISNERGEYFAEIEHLTELMENGFKLTSEQEERLSKAYFRCDYCNHLINKISKLYVDDFKAVG